MSKKVKNENAAAVGWFGGLFVGFCFFVVFFSLFVCLLGFDVPFAFG